MGRLYRYAQVNRQTGVCISVSYLAGEVESDDMIPLSPSDDVRPRDIWDGEEWIRPEPSPEPEPEPDRIDQLEEESAMLALELVDTQIRLDQSESEQAALLLELVNKGVL